MQRSSFEHIDPDPHQDKDLLVRSYAIRNAALKGIMIDSVTLFFFKFNFSF